MKPKISVIVPVFNVEKYLEDCLDSILNQKFDDFEIVCVDDGSSDDSYKILEKYKNMDARIKVISQEYRGVSVARNTAIENALGEYLCFVDSDDMLAEGALEKIWAEVSEAKPEMLIYETGSLLYEEKELQWQGKDEYYRVKKDYSGIWKGRELFTATMENGDFVDSVWLTLVNREWLLGKNIWFCPGMLYEDSIFLLHCYFNCETVKYLKEKLYIYRVRRNSIMTGKYSFCNLQSRIWQFSECIRMIYDYAENEREMSALVKFAEQSMVNIKYIAGCLEEQDLKKMEDMTDFFQLLARSMNIGTAGRIYNKELPLQGLLRMAEQNSEIILYGAGLIGNKVFQYLKSLGHHKKIIGFAVSEYNAEKYKNEIPVKAIADYEACPGRLLIISARENYHKSMINTAEAKGFSQIVCIDYDIETLIDEKLNEL